MFFPSLPFMGVMLFPSFELGNASGEGVVFLASPSPFSILISLPSSFLPLLLFHLFFHVSFSFFCFLFFLPKLLPSHFFFSSFPLLSFPSSFHSVFLLCPSLFFFLSPLFFSPYYPFFFVFEGTACTECFSRCNRGHH